jgi:ribonuclease HI
MRMLVFHMEILDESDGCFRHQIIHQNQHTEIFYNPMKREVVFPNSDPTSLILRENQDQILKILRTKRIDTFYPGFRLKFILMDKKVVSLFNDMTKVIVLDRRNNELEINFTETGKNGIHEIFTDACFLDEKNRSGLATVIKSPKGTYNLKHVASNATNNCLAELEAAIIGLEKLKQHEKVRLVTDSRYVRKGLTEWMFYWRLNNWMTANAEPAKNIDHWKKIDQLTEGKYIEVAWVKGHSGHFENTMCDLYAREAAEKN